MSTSPDDMCAPLHSRTIDHLTCSVKAFGFFLSTILRTPLLCTQSTDVTDWSASQVSPYCQSDQRKQIHFLKRLAVFEIRDDGQCPETEEHNKLRLGPKLSFSIPYASQQTPFFHLVLLLSSSLFYTGQWTKSLHSVFSSHTLSFSVSFQHFLLLLMSSVIWPNHLVLRYLMGLFYLN